MNLRVLYHTCSMVELGEVDYTTLTRAKIKTEIEDDMYDEGTSGDLENYNIKAIICNLNTNKTSIQLKNFEKKTGLKMVYQYKGNQGNVQVFMANVADYFKKQ